jgi:hypothetical protein
VESGSKVPVRINAFSGARDMSVTHTSNVRRLERWCAQVLLNHCVGLYLDKVIGSFDGLLYSASE